MYRIARIAENPFLQPVQAEAWQAEAAFNPCVAEHNGTYHLVYRALSSPMPCHGTQLRVSSIGYAHGSRPFSFSKGRQLIAPEQDWEQYGCEDPRITFLDGTYYIFYTALSGYPFDAANIRVGVALTKDFKRITEKHLVTPFNAKAMALFPEKIGGKIAAVLTVDTDRPPAKVALALFDKPEDIWSPDYWAGWYASLPEHVIPLLRSERDHLEVGAPPVKTSKGWLLVHSYIRNYFSAEKHFGIEAALLDAKKPNRVIGRTADAILAPEMHYELKGDVPNVIFPSGALTNKSDLYIYYGATDTTGCVANISLTGLLKTMRETRKPAFLESRYLIQGFKRFDENPIIRPRPELPWEAQSTFNPAVIYVEGRFHMLYRAMSRDGTSVLGYASSEDGLHFDDRPTLPAYIPREHFEQKLRPGFSGCEDPRLTRIKDRIYLFYTAYDGYTPRVAFSSIELDDFLAQRWHWNTAQVISPPGLDDKDACLLPEKINGKYVIFHRFGNNIHISSVKSLEFGKDQWLDLDSHAIKPRKEYWDNTKFGIAAPPIRINEGWLLFFHRVTGHGNIYKVEALLLDGTDPCHVIAETDATLLEPEMDYEKYGDVQNVVFPCGAVLLEEHIYLYYGGADKVVGVARMRLDAILKRLGV